MGQTPIADQQTCLPRQLTALVVDDEELVLQGARSMLEAAGFAVIVARDGAEAIALFDDHPEIDLLFSDVRMPGIDGIVLADMAVARRPAMPVIYATAYGDDVRRRLGVAHGPMLEKPYGPAELWRQVRAIFGQIRPGP